MPLASGTKLGPYEIIAPVDAGGMGEVYRAKDTRLDRIVATARGAKNFDLFQKPADGATEAKVLLATDQGKYADDFSADGRYVIFENEDPKTKYDLWLLPMSEDRKPIPYLQTAFNEAHARISPDCRWVAYGSDEIGRTEIYVRPFPNAGGGKWQISTGGGDQPVWNRNGKELFYFAPDSQLMSVEVNAGEKFQPGVPKPLFKTDIPMGPLVGGERGIYDTSRDRTRFLLRVPSADITTTPITLIFNWPQALRK